MSNSNKQTELKSTEEVKFKMRRSFSWDKAFYTNDGFLDPDELSSMIEGDGDDVNHELQKIEEIENLEAKLFQEIEASTKKSTDSTSNLSSGKKNAQAKKTNSAQIASSSSSTSIMTVQSTRSSSSSGGNNVKSPVKRSMSSKTGKSTSDGITTKNKVTPVKTRISKTSPASPVLSGSSSSSRSKFSVNQRSKRGSSVPCRSLKNTEKPSLINSRRNDEMKDCKPAVRLIPKTQSNISLKIKPPPVISSSTITNHVVNQKSKSKGDKTSTNHHRSKSTLKNRPISQTPNQNRKQPARSRNLLAPKTVAAVNTGLKPISQKTTTNKPSKKQSNAKKKSRGAENIILVSPEVLDIKGKLNTLKMEISKQKKDRCQETKMSHDESGKRDSSSIIQMNNQTKLI